MFSAGKGVSSVDAWFSTALDIEDVLGHSRMGEFSSLVWSSLVTQLTGRFWTVLPVGQGFLAGFVNFTLASGFGTGWVRDGEREGGEEGRGGEEGGEEVRGVFLEAVLSAWCS